jgi:hypothetical protein
MKANSLTDLSASQLKQALVLKEKIEVLEKELHLVLRASSASAAPHALGKRRTVSAAGRARIAAAARARWAKQRATRPQTAKTATKFKRKISAAGRARLAELARKRWAAAKRAGKKSL